MKLTDLAASLGGIMQVTLVIGKIFTSQYNSYQRTITLINKMFEFNTNTFIDSIDPITHLIQNYNPWNNNHIRIKKNSKSNLQSEEVHVDT